MNDEIGYESNPYLILYSPKLKPTMKSAEDAASCVFEYFVLNHDAGIIL